MSYIRGIILIMSQNLCQNTSEITINVSFEELLNIINVLKIDKFNNMMYNAKDLVNMKSPNGNSCPNFYGKLKTCLGEECINTHYLTNITNVIKHVLDIDNPWDNMMISGGFVQYALNSKHSELKPSDIDIFLYGSKDEQIAKYSVLLEHFSKLESYFCLRGNVTTIIIPSFEYDIQIIPTEPNSTPHSIIKNFDYTYVQFYYDQQGVFGTFEAFESLYRGITKYTKDDFTFDCVTMDRLTKAFMKGFCVEKCQQLDKICDNMNIENALKLRDRYTPNKVNTIRNAYIGDDIFMVNLIKSLYITDICTYKNIDVIQNTIMDIGITDTYYEELTAKKHADQIDNITINNVSLKVINSIPSPINVTKLECTVNCNDIDEKTKKLGIFTTTNNKFEYIELKTKKLGIFPINDCDRYYIRVANLKKYQQELQDKLNNINLDSVTLIGTVYKHTWFKIKKIIPTITI